jgi:hypothetical protein
MASFRKVEGQEGIWFQIVEGGRRGRRRPEGLTLWRERKSSRGKVLRLGGYGQLLPQDFLSRWSVQNLLIAFYIFPRSFVHARPRYS